MIFIILAIYIGCKIIKRTRFLRGHEVDLVSDLQDINDYTEDVSGKAGFVAERERKTCVTKKESTPG